MIINYWEAGALFQADELPLAWVLAGNSEFQKNNFIGEIKKQITITQKVNITVQKLTFKEIKNNIFAFFSMLNSPLIEGNKIIIVEELENDIPSLLINFLENYKGQSMCIFTIKTLSKNSNWYKFFEKTYKCYISFFYVPTNIEKVIVQALKKYALSYPPEVLLFLTHHFILDESYIFKEIEKLSYFLGKKTIITLEEASLCCAPKVIVDINNFCKYLITQDVEKILSYFENIGDFTPIFIIRSSIHYLIALLQIKYFSAQGKTEKEALELLTYKIFLRNFYSIKESLYIITIEELRKIILKLLIIESEIKLVKEELQYIILQEEIIFLAKKQ